MQRDAVRLHRVHRRCGVGICAVDVGHAMGPRVTDRAVDVGGPEQSDPVEHAGEPTVILLGNHSGPTSTPGARTRAQSARIPSNTTRFASPQAKGVPPNRGAKYSPSSRRHSGARRSLSFKTPPSSRKTTRMALTGALALRDA